MRITSRWFAKVAGVVILAGLSATALTACSAGSAQVDKQYMVVANVNEIGDCTAADDPAALAATLQANLDLVTDNPTNKTVADITALQGNEDLTDLTPLAEALQAKIATCSTVAGSNMIGDVPEDIAALIGDPPGVDCVALATEFGLPTVGDKVMLTYITNEVDAGKTTARNTSDSVNIPALPATRDRVNASICTQPEQAAMVGVALVKHQPELVELNAALFEQFQGVTPKEWADKVLSQAISYEDATKTMTGLAGFMTIFDAKVENGLTTAWNYHAETVASTEANVRPIVENPNQYTGDFLVFRVTHKGETGCWVKPFGINVGVGGDVNKGDQRIAGFDCGAPPTTPSTPETPGNPSDECVGTGCNPVQVCPPDKPHGTYPLCKDDPSRDPEQQGNNKPGGGGPAPAVTEPASPPAAGVPTPVYTAPPQVQTPAPQVTTPAQPVPQQTVAPSEQPQNNGEIVGNPDSGCSAIDHDLGFC